MLIPIFIESKEEKERFIHLMKSPKILERNTGTELIKIPIELKSSRFETKKEAERDIYLKILNYLRKDNK